MKNRYSLKSLIEKVGVKQFALLLRMLLDRIPIVLFGKQPESIDNLLDRIVSIIPHRQNYVFGKDFLQLEEYEELCQDEIENLDTKRAVFSSLTGDSHKIFDEIEDLKGWIIGFDTSNELKEGEIKSNMSKYNFLGVYIGLEEIELSLYGLKEKEVDLKFEKNLIQKAINKTDVAVEKMKRVLKKRVKADPSKQVISNIMDFESEAGQIQQNIFNQEINIFTQAGERALAILNRITLLRKLGYKMKISGKTLLETIDCEDVTPDRLLQLVQAEYGEDYSACIKGGGAARFGDRIDGFWG